MESYKVYCHVFPNGKRYVGITRQKLNRRWRDGQGYKQNIRMTNAIKKYGWENITHEVIAEGLTEKEAADLEVRLIKEWDLMNQERGYNYAEGGTHPHHSDDTKKKIGETSKGRKHSEEFKRWISERNAGSGNFMYGKHHTEETKRKISESKKGSVSPNRGKFGGDHPSHIEVDMIDAKTGEVVNHFRSFKEAADYIGRSPSGISSAVNGICSTCGGYAWKRA